MQDAQTPLPATKITPPSRASLVLTTGAAATAFLSWPAVIVFAFSQHAETNDTQILTLAAFATTVTVVTLAFALRYLMHDARVRDHVVLMGELQQIREEIGHRVQTAMGEATVELDRQYVEMISQNAIAHAQLAAMSEQINLKLDVAWWQVYTCAAHDLGYAVEGEAKVIDIRGRLGEHATIRLRGRDGA
jgi:hypothetical protein